MGFERCLYHINKHLFLNSILYLLSVGRNQHIQVNKIVLLNEFCNDMKEFLSILSYTT